MMSSSQSFPNHPASPIPHSRDEPSRPPLPRRDRWTALLWTLLLGGTLGAMAQTDPSVVRELSRTVSTLRLATTTNDLPDLQPFKSLIGQRRMVVLGESTHGAHEPLALRNQLFQFLVQELGFTAIALETGFTESRAIQRFIEGGPGEARELVTKEMSWGFGGFPENLALVEWMRAYNADSRHRRKLRFVGIDLSGAGDGAFPRARRAVDFALETLATRDPEEAAKIRTDLEPLLSRFSSGSYSALTEAERRRLSSECDRLHRALAARQAGIAKADSREFSEWAWALQSIEVARQLDRMLAAAPNEPGTGPGIPPDAWRMMAARDLGMAENVRWVFQSEGPDGKVLVFAHNLHGMNAEIRGGIWSTLRQAPPAMGRHLRRFFGDEVWIAGTSAIAAAEGLSAPPVDPNGWDAALATLAHGQFVLPTQSPHLSPATVRWLHEVRAWSANLGTEVRVALGEALDAVVFLRTLTPSRAD